jgi:hypothetical protein
MIASAKSEAPLTNRAGARLGFWKGVIVKRKPTSNDTPEHGSVAATTQASSVACPDERTVADLAYQRWVERGCPQGSAEEDWFEAERVLRSRSQSED